MHPKDESMIVSKLVIINHKGRYSDLLVRNHTALVENTPVNILNKYTTPITIWLSQFLDITGLFNTLVLYNK